MMTIYLSTGNITVTGKDERKWKHLFKKIYKSEHGRGGHDRLAYSMQERDRIAWDESDGEYWTEYGLFDGSDMSDDEVREAIDDMRYIVCSPYDCTGKPTTCWITWHRNPTGLISYIHRVGLDI